MKQSILYTISISLLLISLISCSGKTTTEEKSSVVEKKIPAGLITHVGVKENPSQSYEVYLPSYHISLSKNPVIVVFDPHGDGKKAIQLFIEGAERYGYIVVASNNVRNGAKDLNESVNALFLDINERFELDKNRIYTAGFSGGAKVASSIAFYKGSIAGVISCGSGFDQLNQQIESQFDLVSIVGTYDFNFQAVRKLNYALREIDFSQILFTFKGGHEWPDAKLISKAIEWLEVKAMTRELLPMDDAKVRTIQLAWAQRINQLNDTRNYYETYIAYGNFIETFQGLYSVDPYKENYKSLRNHPEVHRTIEEEKNITIAEIKAQRSYLDAMKKIDMAWWQTTLSKLHTSQKDTLKEDMRKRLLSFCSMAAYTYTNEMLNQRNFLAADKYLKLYSLIDPQNPDTYYFKACLLAMKNEQDQAIQWLEKAIEKGFSDTYLMNTDTRLDNLRKNPQFKALTKPSAVDF